MNRTDFQKLQGKLEELYQQKEEALDNANDADYPDEDRVSKLEEEIRIIEEMLELVDEYISL